jgi:hypothetical protein
VRIVAVAAALVCATGVAAADDPVFAKRLFDEGRGLYDRGKFLEACVLFEKSFDLDPAVGTKLNLAECAEREGKPRKAWLLWIEAAAEFDRTPDKAPRAKYARERADALAPKLATVVVRVAKPTRRGLAIRIGDREVVAAAEIVERLEAGQVTITASAPGRQTFSTTVTAALGESLDVEIPALSRLSGGAPDPDELPPPTSNTWRTTAFVAGGATVMFAGAYLYAYSQLSAIGFGEDCIASPGGGFTPDSPDGCASGERNRTIGYATGVAGLAAAIVTVVAVVKVRSAGKRRGDIAWTPIVMPRSVGASVQLRW